jgi:DNA-binding transcriptional LysR family regulator
VPVLSDLRPAHPGLRIDLKTSDALPDLAEIGADLATRTGHPGTGHGTVPKLAEIELLLIATPAYLDRAGRPRGTDDLARLDYIQ